jgi:phage terminase large subunit-like protein
MVVKAKTRKVNPDVSARAVAFIESLKHSTGEWAGKHFELMPWQRDEIIRPLFGTLNPDGRRQYRTCYVEVPRKNGKTEVGAAVALFLLFADNEPGAQVYSAAGDRMQAGLIYQAATPMVNQAPALLKRAKIVESQKRIVNYSTNSFYQVLSAEAYSKHGLNAHGILFDELHTQPDRALWDVLTTSTGARRQPLVFVMTTAGYDRNSIGWEIHDYACKVRDGIIDDPTFLSVIYSAPEDADWTDEDVWTACNPALGEFRSLDEMRTLCKRAQETPALEMTFRRLYLNQWVNSVTRWLPMQAWDECAGEVDAEALKGRECTAGLDLASTTDLAALMLIFKMEDGRQKWLPFCWIPEATARERERKERVPYSLWAKQGLVHLTPGNVIDYEFIRQDCKNLAQLYNIKEWAYDRWNADMLVQEMQKDGAVMVPVGMGYVSMNAPTKELMTLVLSKKIDHGGHPILRTHADNLVVEIDPAGNLKPTKAKATQKIDLMVAGILAESRVMLQQEQGPSIYEERGMLAL